MERSVAGSRNWVTAFSPRKRISAMNKKYVVRLDDEERARLETLVSQGRASARTIPRLEFAQSGCGASRTRLARHRDSADFDSVLG